MVRRLRMWTLIVFSAPSNTVPCRCSSSSVRGKARPGEAYLSLRANLNCSMNSNIAKQNPLATCRFNHVYPISGVESNAMRERVIPRFTRSRFGLLNRQTAGPAET